MQGILFSTEALAALLAFQKAEELKLDKVIFEGDASIVVDTLNGNPDAVEWRRSVAIESSR